MDPFAPSGVIQTWWSGNGLVEVSTTLSASGHVLGIMRKASAFVTNDTQRAIEVTTLVVYPPQHSWAEDTTYSYCGRNGVTCDEVLGSPGCTGPYLSPTCLQALLADHHFQEVGNPIAMDGRRVVGLNSPTLGGPPSDWIDPKNDELIRSVVDEGYGFTQENSKWLTETKSDVRHLDLSIPAHYQQLVFNGNYGSLWIDQAPQP